MPHSLIMPKQTGQIEAVYFSLKLYYDSYKKGQEWFDNSKFKKEIIKLIPSLAKGALDGPYLVKQSELARYFGLAEYDYSSAEGKARITPRGMKFYEAYLNNDIITQRKLIIEALLNDSFGRNNFAIKSSDADVDPPKLFIKAMKDFNAITRKQFAYLLYVVHDKQISYDDALVELKHSINKREIIIPDLVANKYSDVKFTIFLTALGICKYDSFTKEYSLSTWTLNNFELDIENLSIYNKEPSIIYTLCEDISVEDEISVVSANQNKKILTAFGYNIKGEKFKAQNNRIPVLEIQKDGKRSYKTNPRIAKTALEIARFECEENLKHETFTSKTGKQYMEAHHLIPMHAQKDFSQNIDRVENIVCICPTCHSAIHYGDDKTRISHLKTLYDLRVKQLKTIGLDVDFGELFTSYYK